MILSWAAIIGIVILVGLVVVLAPYFSLWLQAYFSRAPVALVDLLLMSLRKVDPSAIVRCKVMAIQSGLADCGTAAMEAQFLAGGDVQRVTLAAIAADRAGLDLDWNTAAAIDLAGRDVMDSVRVSVNTKIIHCPDPHDGQSDTLSGMSKDGIQLRVRVLVTVRTNLSQLVGGATEETVIARVGQSVISSIGACDNYRDALGDPALITRQIIAMGLDSQTAYSIVSIDIADIDVGENIGARLQIDQAEAEIRVARADAEQRLAAALARQQEMKALATEQRANVVLAEAQIPAAMAHAFRTGQLQTPQTRSRVAELSNGEYCFPIRPGIPLGE